MDPAESGSKQPQQQRICCKQVVKKKNDRDASAFHLLAFLDVGAQLINKSSTYQWYAGDINEVTT